MEIYKGSEKVKITKKILVTMLGVPLLFIFGCSAEVSTISYSYEEAEAVITSVDVEEFDDGDCTDGDWFISVEYNGTKFVDSGCISDGVPSYAKLNVGDVVNIQLKNEYIDGKLSERRIEKIIE